MAENKHIQIAPEIYVGFYDPMYSPVDPDNPLEPTDRYTVFLNVLSGDKAKVISNLQKVDSYIDEESTDFITGVSIKNIRIVEQLDSPSKMEITGYLRDGLEKEFQSLIERRIHRLDVLIALKISMMRDGSPEMDDRYLKLKLKNIKVQKSTFRDIGFTLECVHWMDTFAEMPVGHVLTLNGGQYMPFFSSNTLTLTSGGTKVDNSKMPISVLGNYRNDMLSKIREIIKQEESLEHVADIIISSYKYVLDVGRLTINNQEAEKTKYKQKYRSDVYGVKLATQYITSTQEIMKNEFLPFLYYLKDKLSQIQVRKFSKYGDLYYSLIENLRDTIYSFSTQMTWTNFVVRLLSFFGINLSFDLLSMSNVGSTIVEVHTNLQDVDGIGIIIEKPIPNKFGRANYMPDVLLNEPFYAEFASLSSVDNILNINFEMPSSLPYTRISFIPPAEIYSSIRSQSQEYRNYNIVIPDLENKRASDEESNFGMKLLFSPVDKWIGFLLLLYLKVFKEITADASKYSFKKNLYLAEQEKLEKMKVDLTRESNQLDEIVKAIDGEGKYTNVVISDLTVEQLYDILKKKDVDIVTYVKKMLLPGSQIASIAYNTLKSMTVGAATSAAIESLGPTDRTRVEDVIRAITSKTGEGYVQKELLEKINARLDAIDTEINTAETKVKKQEDDLRLYAGDKVSEAYIEDITHFLFWVNKYSNNNGSLSMPLFDLIGDDCLGKIISFEGDNYTGNIRGVEHIIDSEGMVGTSLMLSYILERNTGSPDNYPKNPVFNKERLSSDAEIFK